MDAGADLFRALLAKENGGRRRDVLNLFLMEMVDQGKALEAYRAAPDAHEAFRILADDLQGGPRRDDLPPLLAAHRAKHTDDPWLAFYTGWQLQDMEKWQAAVDAYAAAWKKAPQDLRQRMGGSYVYALTRAGRPLEAYQKVEPRHQTFTQVANQLAMERQGAQLEALIAAHRPHAAAGDPDLLFQAARAKFFLKLPDAAVHLLQEAYQKQTQNYRKQDCVATLVREMALLGRGLEGYRAAPDRAYAFETLARDLVFAKKAKKLQALLGEHGKAYAGTAWYHFYTGELRLLQGEAQQAITAFKAAQAAAPPQANWAFRNGLLRARVRAGQAAAAYKELGADRRAFADLAFLCQQDKNAGQLKQLLAARRGDAADEADLIGWDLEVLWLSADYDGALRLLTEHRAGLFALPQHQYKHNNYLVRCLVKLKRTGEAVDAAEKIVQARFGNRLLLILAHAAHGDAKKVAAVLEGERNRRYLVEDCYRDPDLGPLLRGGVRGLPPALP